MNCCYKLQASHASFSRKAPIRYGNLEIPTYVLEYYTSTSEYEWSVPGIFGALKI